MAVGIIPFRPFEGADACEADGSGLANVDGAEGVQSSVPDAADVVGEGDVYASG